MRIDFDGGEFVVSCKFEERHLPRAAGFKFDPERRKWVTRSTGLAVMFGVDKLTDRARKSIGLDGEIPCPDGLAYLDFQKDGIKFGLEHLTALIADQPGLGKGHPVTTQLLTPTGYRALGDLVYGDWLIGVTGAPIPVTGIFERGVIPIYSVRFSDGATIQCDGEHLWTVYPVSGPGETLDTMALAARLHAGDDLAIPTLFAPAETLPKVFNVTPLEAGTDQATSHGIDIKNRPAYPEIAPYDVRDYSKGSASQCMDFLKGIVTAIGRVRGDDCHLRIDIVKKPQAKHLVSTITACVHQLGGLIFKEQRFRRIRLRVYLPDHVAYPVFGYANYMEGHRLYRRWRDFKAIVPRRRIVSIEPCGRDKVRCISVEGFGNLYVAEKAIVTHNTIQGVGVMNATPNLQNGLIVSPASLKRNWFKEIAKWSTHKNLSVDIAQGPAFPKSDIVIINYDILARHRDKLREREWDIVIPDEQHYLKNKDSGRTKEFYGGVFKTKDGPRTLKHRIEPIPAKRLLLLGGTPITNKPGDLWTTVQACDPLRLGRDYEKFHTTYSGGYWDANGFVPNGTPDEDALREFNKLAKERFMIRRLKADVLHELPPKIRRVVPLPMDGLRSKIDAEKKVLTDLLDIYEKMVGIRKEMSADDLVSAVFSIRPETWEKYAEQCSGDITADTPLARLARARRDLAVAKLPMVIEYLQNLLDQGEKVVCFGYHQAVIEGLLEHFRKRNDFSTACIYGKTPQESVRFPERTRTRQVEMFQDDAFCRLFIGQYTAAGTGWTLTAARHWVAAEEVWGPAELLQAEDRCHRIGSEIWDSVWADHLIVEGSLDDTFIAKIFEKMRYIELALD
jgi:SWI/SNF-related matrix-associated actin-dependent regulator 1 of chromatin subfamily A